MFQIFVYIQLRKEGVSQNTFDYPDAELDSIMFGSWKVKDVKPAFAPIDAVFPVWAE